MCQTGNAFGNGTNQDSCQSGPAVRRHHDQIKLSLLGKFRNLRSRITESYFRLYAAFDWLRETRLHFGRELRPLRRFAERIPWKSRVSCDECRRDMKHVKMRWLIDERKTNIDSGQRSL